MDPMEEVQNTIRQVLPVVLVGPGIVLAASGLFMWLGGLRWLKAIAAFGAALAGVICAWFFTERQLVAMVLFPVILAGIGIYFHKVIVVLLGAVTAGLIVLFVPMIADVSESPQSSQAQPAEQPLDLLESIDWVQEKIQNVRQEINDVIAGIPESRKYAAMAAVVVVCVLGLFSWRLVCAAACSVMGTVLLFGGMVLLLLYKGSEPLNLMVERRNFLALVVLIMIVAGMFLQLVLIPAKPKKINKDDIMKEVLNEGGKK